MLAPGRLRLPQPLADDWPAMLARAGVGVIRTGAKAVLHTGDEQVILYVDEGARGGICDLYLVTDGTWRRRMETIFLSSGASMEDPLDKCPTVHFAYRVSESQWNALRASWLKEGAELDHAGPWASAKHVFPSGELRSEGARLPLETGPALAPDGEPARYVDLLPRFFLRLPPALDALMKKTHDQLQQAGAAAVDSDFVR